VPRSKLVYFSGLNVRQCVKTQNRVERDIKMLTISIEDFGETVREQKGQMTDPCGMQD